MNIYLLLSMLEYKLIWSPPITNPTYALLLEIIEGWNIFWLSLWVLLTLKSFLKINAFSIWMDFWHIVNPLKWWLNCDETKMVDICFEIFLSNMDPNQCFVVPKTILKDYEIESGNLIIAQIYMKQCPVCLKVRFKLPNYVFAWSDFLCDYLFNFYLGHWSRC